MSNVVVQFYPERGRPSSARTDGDGNFTPEFSAQIPHGVVPGKHRISIQVVPQSIDERINLQDPKYHPEMPEILKHFGNWKDTPLEVDVSHRSPKLDIELDDYLPPGNP